MDTTRLYRLLDHPQMEIDQNQRALIAYASPEDRAKLAGTIPFFIAHMDAYLERVLIQQNLIRFFDAVNQYVNQHVLKPDDMIVRAACGHRYITRFTSIADTLEKHSQQCPECQAQEQESLSCAWCGTPGATFEADGKLYCNEDCAFWDHALDQYPAKDDNRGAAQTRNATTQCTDGSWW